MHEILQAYSKETFTLVAVLLGFLLNRFFRMRPRLFYSVRNSSTYPVNEPLKDASGAVVMQQQVVRTASIVSENNGLLPAKGVEFTFNWKPPIFTVFPGRAFSTEDTGLGRWTIKLESLAPGEVFGIEIMSINQELPLISSMRSEETEGRLIIMVPTRKLPGWATWGIAYLMLAGIAATLYALASATQWIAG